MTDNIAVKLIQKLQDENKRLHAEHEHLSKELKHKTAWLNNVINHDKYVLKQLNEYQLEPEFPPELQAKYLKKAIYIANTY
jgi:hypothetical protein